MKEDTKKTYMMSIGLNAILFLMVALFLDKMSLGLVLLCLSIIPLTINAISILNEYKKTGLINKYHYYLPISTLLIYLIFGMVSLNNGKWELFRQSYARNFGDTSVEIANSPISPSQLIFTAIMYIAIGYLITKLIESRSQKKNNKRNDNVTRSKSFE